MEPNWVSFPLIKFSYHTGPNGTRAHTWTHVNYRNDLEFILRDVRIVDDYGNYETRIWMKVTGGVEESQDLSQLVSLVQECSSFNGGDHPIDIVVKSPFLAMKYPKTTDTVRRIQVKFRKESDFTQVVQMFMRLGLSVLDRDTQYSVPASKNNPLSIGSSNSVVFDPNLPLPRPSSTGLLPLSDSNGSFRVSLSSPVKANVIKHTQLDSAISEHRKFTPDNNPYPLRPSKSFTTNSTNSELIPSSSLSRVLSLHDVENACPSLLLPQNHEKYQSRHLSQPILPKPTLDYHKPIEKGTFQFSQYQPQDDKNSYLSKISKTAQPVSPSYLSQFDDESSRELRVTESFPKQATQKNFEHACPSFPQVNIQDDKEIWIPPKRELPFSTPKEQSKASPAPLEDFPPLPKPTPLKKNEQNRSLSPMDTTKNSKMMEQKPKKPTQLKSTALKCTERPKSRNKSELQSKNSDGDSLIANTDEVSPESTCLGKETYSNKKRSAPSRPTKTKKRPKMVDQGTQTLNILKRNDILAWKNASNSCNFHLANNSPDSEPFLDNGSKTVRKPATSCKDRAPDKELCNITGYAEADDEARHSLLRDFICENLENKNFLKLCSDIEFSWQRIYLNV